MTSYPVRITQFFRVKREIVIDVEADDSFEAVDIASEADAPPSSDPRWTSIWTLEHEDVDPA